MLSALLRLTDYPKDRTRQQMRLIVASDAEATTGMDAIDAGHAASYLPWDEIAGPYMSIIMATGKVLPAEQLLQLLEWPPRLNMPWDIFVYRYVLPQVQQSGAQLLLQLGTMFQKEAA